jgi:RNA polymerase sigma-70 factor (ECF subfamily)
MSGPDSQSALLTRAVAGDRAALAQLFLQHYDTLQEHVESRLTPDVRGLVRAEDVIQQTFVRAAQAVTTFVPRHADAFHGWLVTIADNLVRDLRRRRGRERRVADLAGPVAGADNSAHAGPGVDQLAGAETSPSRRAGRREVARHLQAALSTLPDDQRDVLHRRYLLGESLDEIARATGRTTDAVRGLCFRARKKLRGAMGRSSLYFSQ